MSDIFLKVLTKQVSYHPDPTLVFATLCENKPNTLLLESAEISSKNSLKSLLLINSAIKITCNSNKVTFQALTENGTAILPLIYQTLQNKAQFSQIKNTITAEFSPLDPNLDEDTKLIQNTIFDALRSIIQLFKNSAEPIFLGGLFAYDLVANFIPMEQIKLEDDGLNCPDFVFYLAEQLLTLDHENKIATLKTFCFDENLKNQLSENSKNICQNLTQIKQDLPIIKASDKVTVNIEDNEFKQIIANLKTYLNQGDIFQIVPSRRFSIACPNTLASYRRLKITNPSPYMFFMQDEEFTLFGASPESALKFCPNTRQIEIYPIAGSRPRGFDEKGNIDPELDARLELELRLDAKELAEHLMLVDLARNDVARVCEPNTRIVKDLMQVDRYSHIMHLVSRVTGKLRADLDALHAYLACMNMGTLTGAPKIKAMQLIYQFEKQKRHSYGGAVGYLFSDGSFDTCIVIRSAFVQNSIAYVQAGCGEVLESNPQMEANETRHKAKAVLNAIAYTNLQGMQ